MYVKGTPETKHQYFPPHFVVKKGIHGYGVFTTMAFKKGETLFKLKGEIINSPTRTSVQIAKDKHIEDIIAGQINHNCAPNSRVNRKAGTFVSLKNIKKNEELTFDYNQNEDILSSPFICECCGKKILGKKKLKD